MFRGRSEMTEAIQRELEKERIREEIIAEEMARKRILEAEVRKELMMEREMMAMRSDGESSSPFKLLSLLPSHKNLFEPGILHRQPIGTEERIAVPLEEKYGRGGHRRGRHCHEIKGFEEDPSQRSGDSPKIKGIPTTLPGNSKKEVIGLGKPNRETLSRTKWKSTSPVAGGSSELRSDSLKKKLKDVWSCAICQVSATSEFGFNEHLQGKKHQAKEADLIARKTGANFGLGVAPKKPIVQLASRTVNFSSLEKKSKARKESVKQTPITNKTSRTFDSNDSKKEDGMNGEHKREKFMFGCKMCLVGANSEHDMNNHKVRCARKESVKQTPITNKTSRTFDSNDSKKEDGMNGEDKREKFMFWCKMCQVGANSEHDMNNHKVGKKHLTKFFEQLQNGEVKAEAPGTEKTCDTEEKTDKTSRTFDSNDLKKEDGMNGEHKREKFKFWCKMCQVGANTEHVMNNHKVGKKHLTKFVEQLQNGKVKAEAPGTEKTCDTEEKTEAETKKAVAAAEIKSFKDDKQDVTAKEPDTLVEEDEAEVKTVKDDMEDVTAEQEEILWLLLQRIQNK